MRRKIGYGLDEGQCWGNVRDDLGHDLQAEFGAAMMGGGGWWVGEESPGSSTGRKR